ncbi:MAG TPA: DUF4145 domain-containing protein [Hyphomicrobium sp.]|nr:DUF4145 domain-containing protein [Hyphomicrobium sp.]
MPYLATDDNDLDRSFTCSACGVFSVQRATRLSVVQFGSVKNADIEHKTLHFIDCDSCGQRILFAGDEIIFPQASAPVEKANSDLPDDATKDYEEAAAILVRSPRGACALLRLCLMKLMVHLGHSGNLDDDIKSLVRAGLDIEVQQSCDVVRVIGNNAVHPGVIDLRDDRATAERLFQLINFITDQLITQPLKRAKFYDTMIPDGTKASIARRDGKAP